MQDGTPISSYCKYLYGNSEREVGLTPLVFSSTGQFWHVTDFHLDPTYHITGDHTKVCASSKGAKVSDPGPFGDVMCDSPYRLIFSALDFIKNSGQKVSFMIWTG